MMKKIKREKLLNLEKTNYIIKILHTKKVPLRMEFTLLLDKIIKTGSKIAINISEKY